VPPWCPRRFVRWATRGRSSPSPNGTDEARGGGRDLRGPEREALSASPPYLIGGEVVVSDILGRRTRVQLWNPWFRLTA